MQKKNRPRIFLLIEDILFYIIIIPMIIIVGMLLWQTITEPDKIPNIFGYKLFIILDENMDATLDYGDLVFTKNVDTNTLKNGNVIAFRNNMNTVTIHKITDISKTEGIKTFTMQTAENETADTKYAKEEKVEGILVKKIPKIGLIIWYSQKPWILIVAIGIILIIGSIAYYFAQKLDKRDMLILEEANKNSTLKAN